MRFFLAAVAAAFAVNIATTANAATYLLDTLSLPCTFDCNNFGPNPGAMVSMSGTITTDSDAGLISVSNIVDWAITIVGPENGSLTYTPDDDAVLVPDLFQLNGSKFVAAGSGVEIFADGTNFAVSLLPGAPETTSTFQFLARGLNPALAELGILVEYPLSQVAFIMDTDAAGNSELDRSIVSRDPLISSTYGLQFDTGADNNGITQSFTALSGTVTNVSTVPLPGSVLLQGSGLLLFGYFGLYRRKRFAGV